jgi:hypothetical protein
MVNEASYIVLAQIDAIQDSCKVGGSSKAIRRTGNLLASSKPCRKPRSAAEAGPGYGVRWGSYDERTKQFFSGSAL